MLRSIVILSTALTLAALASVPWPDKPADPRPATIPRVKVAKLNRVRFSDGATIEIHLPSTDIVAAVDYTGDIALKTTTPFTLNLLSAVGTNHGATSHIKVTFKCVKQVVTPPKKKEAPQKKSVGTGGSGGLTITLYPNGGATTSTVTIDAEY